MIELKYSKRRRFAGLHEILKPGYSVMIAHLDRDYEPDEKIEDKDVRKLETILKFHDRESVEEMIVALQNIAKEWKDV